MTKKQTPAEMVKEHFANMKEGGTLVFRGTACVWKIKKVVERGAVIHRLDNGSHEHLAEWHKLALATFN